MSRRGDTLHRCSECGAGIEDDPRLIREQIVCKRCHDLIQPECPYCGTRIRRKNVPKRRSSFGCKACGEYIEVIPGNWLYGSVYLTDEQAGYLSFLEQLDHWVFTIGSQADYIAMQAALRKKFGGEPGIGDVIWGLMNESVRLLCEEHGAKMEDVSQLFDGQIPRGMAHSSAKEFLKDVRKLMKDFRAFDREVKKEKKPGHRRT